MRHWGIGQIDGHDTTQQPGANIRRCTLREGRHLLIALVIMMLGTLAHAALWYESYDEAEQAIRNEEWTRAVRLLEQAISEKAESGLGVRTYGVNFIDYFPYLKLGIAHYNLGNHDAALTAFEREELLGAVNGSPDGLRELRRVRELAQESKDRAAAIERNRVVEDGLALAAQLEAEGKLEEAITEARKVVAVDPENAQAKDVVAQLETKITLDQLNRQRQGRFDDLVEQGRRFLEQENFADAASVLAQAFQLDPESADARALFDQAQSALTAQLEDDQAAEERVNSIAANLDQARSSFGDGEFSKALSDLQRVLALDSENADALSLKKLVLEEQDRAEIARIRGEGVQELLDQVRQASDEGDFDQALSLVSRALAINPQDREAFQLLQRIQQRFRNQIETIGATTLPPAIVFTTDRRGEHGVQQILYPEFVLTGVVYSTAPLAVLDYWVGDERLDLLDQPYFFPVQRLADDQLMLQFEIRRGLSYGESRLKIVATDDVGKTATREYEVFYPNPPHTTPEFYVLLALAASVLIVAWYVRRRVLRQRKLKRKFNPYIAGAPVLQDSQFIGRDRLMQRVLQTVHNNSILLYGERRIGKTSFQHRLKRRLEELQDPDFDFYPVYIDLQGTPETKFFSTLAHDIFDELGSALEGVRPSAALTDGSEYGYRELVRDIRGVLKALKAKGKKRPKLVLLIDEVDELNSYNPRVNQRLRSLFMRNFAEDLVAVVSGVGIKKHWESEGSPWYNFFEEVEVKPFRREEAVVLIERPIRGALKLEKGVTDRIIDLTDCKPYLIQKLCVALVNEAYQNQRRTITLADVENIGRPAEDLV